MAETGQGIIKWYNDAKGYGFIDRGPDDEDIWFHGRDRAAGIDEGQFVQGAVVEFTVGHSPRGTKAEVTRVLSASTPPPPPEVPAYTMDDALKGLKDCLLGAVEWVDIIDALRKDGQA